MWGWIISVLPLRPQQQLLSALQYPSGKILESSHGTEDWRTRDE
jgi:hypothetical protein